MKLSICKNRINGFSLWTKITHFGIFYNIRRRSLMSQNQELIKLKKCQVIQIRLFLASIDDTFNVYIIFIKSFTFVTKMFLTV